MLSHDEIKRNTTNHKNARISTPQESTPRIYRPLAQIKDFYRSESHSSSVQAEASSQLPHIESKRKHTHCSTQRYQYSTTVNDVLEMKLKTGQIHDEISFIDLKMREEKEKYHNAVSKHRNFTKTFDEFLHKQYQQVKRILQKLETRENESSQLKKTLHELRQTITEKSLNVYELEAQWRRYKMCERFLLHISPLLRSDSTKFEFLGNFRVDPNFETPTLDELISNFRKHDQNSPFDQSQYAHVTAAKLLEFLSKLKRQNLKMLRYKLEQQKLTNVLEAVNVTLETDFHDEMATLEQNVHDMRTRADNAIREVDTVKEKCESVVKNADAAQKEDAKELKTFIEQLYVRCFEPTYQVTSHVQLARYVEDYCHALLCDLYSFEPCVLKKVLKK